MNLQRSYYEILGVSPRSSKDEIKRKYRELARKFHPDKAQDKDTAQKVFAQINKAYATLSDADKRARYDASLETERENGSRPANGNPTSNGLGTPPVPTGPLTPQQAANVAKWLADAETALMENKLDNARAVCQLILKTDGRNTKALGFLGEVLERMGKPQEAIAAYRQALQIAPSAMLQAKLNRLQGAGSAPPSNGPGRTPPPSPPPLNGNGPRRTPTPPPAGTSGNGAAKPKPEPAKQSGGFLGRLLGKK